MSLPSSAPEPEPEQEIEMEFEQPSVIDLTEHMMTGPSVVLKPTHGLRWLQRSDNVNPPVLKPRVLQQAFISLPAGEVVWQDVPTVEE
jgi:hypothetical protein